LVRSNLFCSITDVPLSNSGSSSRIVLMVFKGSRTDIDETALTSKIRGIIAEEMGNEFQPDRIVFFPIYPRFLSDMEVDHDWCQSQFLSGALSRKSRGKIFRCITRLRECVLLADKLIS